MTIQVYIVIALTFIISIISTLAYSIRVVGIKTGRIAIAFSVFNIFALISRTANTFQAPLLTKTVESSIKSGHTDGLIIVFRCILLASTAAAIFGAFLMPTFIRVFSKAVESFSFHRSIPRLLFHGFSKAGIEQFKSSITIPKRSSFSQLTDLRRIPKKIVVLNIVATSISSVGVLAAIYAGTLVPDFRSTCTTLSSVINGVSTILLFIFIDPYISMLTDDVIRGKCPEQYFNRIIAYIVAGLILGTMLAQLLLLPAAGLIAFVVKL